MKKIVLAWIAIVLIVGITQSFSSSASSSPLQNQITAVQPVAQVAAQAPVAPQAAAVDQAVPAGQPAMRASSCGGSCNPATCGCSPSQCSGGCGGSCGQAAQTAQR